MNFRSAILTSLGILTLCASTYVLGAEEYIKGNGALEVFDGEGMEASPLWVRMWVGFMVLMFATGLFIFAWKQAIARWVAGGFIVSVSSGAFVFSALNLPFLSGSIAIMHLICWTPGLAFLILKQPFLDSDQGMAFRIWSVSMTGTILFSFVFDIRDAWIYISHVS